MNTTRVNTQGTGLKIISQATELKKRLVSGIVLICLLVGCIYYSFLSFAILVGVTSIIISWEWSHMIRKTPFDSSLLFQVILVAVSSYYSYKGFYFQAVSLLLIGATFVLAISRNKNPYLCSLGILYAGFPAVSLLWLRADSSFGLPVIFYLFSIVIATDTFSFLIGKLIGGIKLAPKISPNKTMSGFLGGIILPALFTLGACKLINHPYSLSITSLFLSLLCQIGDLAESLLKRKFDIKDSSNLIPGHGGFLDRVDGLIFVSIGAGLLALVINPQSPAKALLFWSFLP